MDGARDAKGDNNNLERKFRLLVVAVIGLMFVVIGLIVFSLFKPVESATSPGTCLPESKGGTNCDPVVVKGMYESNEDTNAFSDNYKSKLDSINTTYSAQEQTTGETWVDGKPIYRRVFSGTFSATAGAYTVFEVSSVLTKTNCTIIDYGGWIGVNNSNDIVPIPFSRPNGGGTTIDVSAAASTYNGNLNIAFRSWSDITDKQYQLWVEYVKL